MKTFGIDSSPGTSGTYWTGELPLTGHNLQHIQQYLQNNQRLRVGRIMDVHAGAYVAQVNTGLGNVAASWCSDTIGGLFGSGSITVPQYGSYVLVFTPPSGASFILGCIPPEGFSSGVLYRALLGSGVTAHTEDAHTGPWQGPQQGLLFPHNGGRPVDTFPGDTGWFNEDGGVLGLFKGAAAILKASELAQVQALSCDDLVRIVARTLQIFHALGQTSCYVDEQYVNYEFTGATKFCETVGQSNATDISQDSTEVDGYLKPKTLTPKHRFQLHAGWLGDLLHLFLQNTEQEGVGHLHLSDVGGFTYETTDGILLKRTSKLNTPNRLKEPNDPEGDGEVTPTEVPEYTWSEPFKAGACLEEEDYLNYKKKKQGLRRFKDYPKDWEVKEKDTEESIESHLHIRKDGSIVLKSSSGSTIELTSDGDIVLAPARDLLVQPGRDMACLVPGTANIRSYKHCSIISDTGDVRLKADKNLQAYCKQGGILLEAEGAAVPVTAPTGGDQTTGGILLRSKKEAPIVLDALNSNIQLEAAKHITLRTQNASAVVRVDTSKLECTAQTSILLSTATTYVEGVSLNVDISGAIQEKTGTYTLSGRTVAITGDNSCIVHAPGGVNVAHIHPRSEWTYTADAHGQYGIRIEKTNGPVPANPSRSSAQDTNTLLQPWVPATYANMAFLYTGDERTNPLYLTYWQNYCNPSQQWDLTEDVQGTTPYPGKDFPGLLFYTSLLSDDPPANGGSFSTQFTYPFSPLGA